MNVEALGQFLEDKLASSGRPIAARLQTALALLERLRDHPVLQLKPHLSASGQSLISHEPFGNSAHQRLGLGIVNKNHGRRSSNINDWGQGLLDLPEADGFNNLAPLQRDVLLDKSQERVAKDLRGILEQEPLAVRVRGRSAEAIIADALAQADARGRIAEVAQYLVGAKLQLRFRDEHDRIAVMAANKGDRKARGDEEQRRGDFDLGHVVFEVAAGLPDLKHLAQVADVLEDPDSEMWLLVRGHRLQSWKDEVARADVDHRRVVVASIELFVGQNVAELGGLSAAGAVEQITELFRIYNTDWVERLGLQGCRIVLK